MEVKAQVCKKERAIKFLELKLASNILLAVHHQ